MIFMYRFLLISVLSLLTIFAKSQVSAPEPFKKYQLVNSEGFAFGYVDGSAKQCIPDEYASNQAFEFVKTDDDSTYYIKSTVDDSYVCKITSSWNSWDITFEGALPSEVSRAKYSIEVLDSDYVLIKNMHAKTYVGVRSDAVETGWGIYLNLTYNEHLNNTVKIKWKIMELPTDAETLFNEELEKLVVFSEGLGEYPGIQVEISDYMIEISDKASGAASPNDELYYECIDDINKYIEKVNNGIKYISGVKDLYAECEDNFDADVYYPGLSDLEEAYAATNDIFNADDTRLEDYIKAYDALKEALIAYYNSQVPVATEENPADLTYYIKYPNFRKSYNYFSECEVTSDGWLSNATNLPSGYVNVGPQHKYSDETGRDVTCFAGWSWQYGIIEVYQDIVGLPDGKYTVECEAFTAKDKVYKQRAYASADGIAVADTATEAMSGAWEQFRTPLINVVNGKLRIGFFTESMEGGGDTGWFIVTGFKLKYCGAVSAEEITALYKSKWDECRAQCDTMLFEKDRTTFNDSIAKYMGLSDVGDMKDAIRNLSIAQVEAQKSVDKQVQVMSGIFSALNDSISSGAYTDEYAAMTQGFCNGMSNAISANGATYTEMDSIQFILQYYRDAYLPVYSMAKNKIVNDTEAKAVLNSNIARHVETYTNIEVLPSKDNIDKFIAELNLAMDECVVADLILSGTDDFTGSIKNPTIDCASRWTAPYGWNVSVVGSGNGEIVSSGQQVDGNVNGCYLSAWHGTPGHVLLNGHQTIENLPNGLYELKAMVRTTADHGSYLYAIADKDSSTTVLKELKMERMNITELGGPSGSDGKDSIAVVSGEYGSIFAELYKRTNGASDATDAQADTLNANSGKGHGWFYESLEIEVKDHALTIGFTNDSTFTMKHGGVPFEGSWLSADNFILKLLKEGDNSDWHPSTGIDEIAEDEMNGLELYVKDGSIISNGSIYNINGLSIPSGTKVPSGVYIVKYGKYVKKVLVR